MRVFFKAILAGYAGDGSGVKKEKSPDGYKTLIYEEGKFRVADRYCVTPHSDKSAGTTTIFFEGQPIWWMSYGGEYHKSEIPLLKEALSKAYHEQTFCGGRGPETFGDLYFNRFRGNFESFSGTEVINSPRGNVLGYHHYLGMSLI
jgi:hypothetical protein